MKTLILTLLSIIFLPIATMAQNFHWAKQLSGISRGNEIVVDATGNVYIIGNFQDTTDFDPGPNVFNLISEGGWDIFITKLDPTGNLIWAKQFGGATHDAGAAIGVDASGNVYTAGTFKDTVDFDPGTGAGEIFNLISNGTDDIFISKLDPAGNFVWAKQIGGAGFDIVRSLEITPTGTLFLTGKFDGSVDFNPATAIGDTAFLHSAGAGIVLSDIFIAEYNSSGNLQWAKQIGGAQGQDVFDVKADANNLYLTGHFAGTIDLDPDPVNIFNLNANGSYDAFIAKLDLQGNLVWAKSFGGSRVVWSNNIALDALGNVYTTGEIHSDTVDFDPGTGPNDTLFLTAIGTNDWFPGTAYISKLDASGDFIWAKTIGSYSIGSEIAVDPSNNIYVAGVYSGTLRFDIGTGDTTKLVSGSNLNSDRGAFITRLNGAGNYEWAAGLTGTSLSTDVSAIDVDASGNIYSTGSFIGTTDFDPGTDSFKLTSEGIFVSDAYVHKMGQEGVGINEKKTNRTASIYPNPTAGSFFIHFEDTYSNVDVSIRNINGQLISIHHFNASDRLMLNIPQNAGLYFVEVRIDNGNPIYLKVIKQ